MGMKIFSLLLLSVGILLNQSNEMPQKRQQSKSCRAKFSEAKNCHRWLIQTISVAISLLKEDRLEEFKAVDGSINKEIPSCNTLRLESEECCEAENDCTLVQAEIQWVNSTLLALGEEREKEENNAKLRAKQRANPSK